MVTIKSVDIMKDYGERFYVTLRNLKVILTEQYLPGGYRQAYIAKEDLNKAILSRVPSIEGRKDIVIHLDRLDYAVR